METIGAGVIMREVTECELKQLQKDIHGYFITNYFAEPPVTFLKTSGGKDVGKIIHHSAMKKHPKYKGELDVCYLYR